MKFSDSPYFLLKEYFDYNKNIPIPKNPVQQYKLLWEGGLFNNRLIDNINVDNNPAYGNDSNTKLLLQSEPIPYYENEFDYDSFIDSSDSGYTITKGISSSYYPKHMIVSSKFGNTCIGFYGDGDYLQVSNQGTIVDLTTNDSTIDVWIRPTLFNSSFSNLPTSATIGKTEHYTTIFSLDGVNNTYSVVITPSGSIGVVDNSYNWVCQSDTNTFTTSAFDKWYYISFDQEVSGANLSLYVNGSFACSGVTTSITSYDRLVIGADSNIPSATAFTGFMEEFRVSDVIRSHTPSTQPYNKGWSVVSVSGSPSLSVDIDGKIGYTGVITPYMTNQVNNGWFINWSNGVPENWTVSTQTTSAYVVSAAPGIKIVDNTNTGNIWISQSNLTSGTVYEYDINVAFCSGGYLTFTQDITGTAINTMSTSGIYSGTFTSNGNPIYLGSTDNNTLLAKIISIEIRTTTDKIGSVYFVDFHGAEWNFETVTVEASATNSYLVGMNKGIFVNGDGAITLYIDNDSVDELNLGNTGYLPIKLSLDSIKENDDGLTYFNFTGSSFVTYRDTGTIIDSLSGTRTLFTYPVTSTVSLPVSTAGTTGVTVTHTEFVTASAVTYRFDEWDIDSTETLNIVNGQKVYFRKDSFFHDWLIGKAESYLKDKLYKGIENIAKVDGTHIEGTKIIKLIDKPTTVPQTGDKIHLILNDNVFPAVVESYYVNNNIHYIRIDRKLSSSGWSNAQIDLYNKPVNVRDYLNVDKTFIYFGKIYRTPAGYSVIYEGLKDYVLKTVPYHQRTNNLKEFFNIYYDKLYHNIYTRQKDILSMLDPMEIDINYLGYLSKYYGYDDIDKISNEPTRQREFVKNIIHFIKRKGTFTDLYVIWKIITQSNNYLNVYEKWHSAGGLSIASTSPSGWVDHLYLSRDEYGWTPPVDDGAGRAWYSDARILGSDSYCSSNSDTTLMLEYPSASEYSLTDKILSTHYRVELDINNEPISTKGIFPKDIALNLFDAFEFVRPINRVAHYNIVFAPKADFSGLPVSLYPVKNSQGEYYDNVYVNTTSYQFRLLELGSYIGIQCEPSKVWTFNHNLDSDKLMSQIFDLDFNEIVPQTIKYSTMGVSAIFEEERTGYVLLKRVTTPLYTRKNTNVENWTIKHNLNNDRVLVQFINDDNERLFGTTTQIIDENNIYVDIQNNGDLGNITTLIEDDETINIYTQLTSASEWVIDHNLKEKGLIISCYNTDGLQIYPKDVILTTENNTRIIFESPQSGYVAILKIGNPDVYELLLEFVNGTQVSPIIQVFDIDGKNIYESSVNAIYYNDDEYFYIDWRLGKITDEFEIKTIKLLNQKREEIFVTETSGIYKPSGVNFDIHYRIKIPDRK